MWKLSQGDSQWDLHECLYNDLFWSLILKTFQKIRESIRGKYSRIWTFVLCRWKGRMAFGDSLIGKKVAPKKKKMTPSKHCCACASSKGHRQRLTRTEKDETRISANALQTHLISTIQKLNRKSCNCPFRAKEEHFFSQNAKVLRIVSFFRAARNHKST